MKDLSVVVACIDAKRSISTCLQRLRQTCVGLNAELIVLHAPEDDTGLPVDSREHLVRAVRCASGSLAPELWAEGYRQARGRVIAFTTGHSLVSPGWARSLLDALGEGASGAGGPLSLARDTSLLDWGVFYLRYSAFTADRMGGGPTAGEIAGDNSAYPRAVLALYEDSFAHGFWELDLHRRIRRDGGWLSSVPSASVEFGPSFRLSTILRHRFSHGRHSGASRVASGARRAWQIVAAAPAVPVVLACRAASRVHTSPLELGRFLLSLPWFLLLASAWAAGEAWGAWDGYPGHIEAARG